MKTVLFSAAMILSTNLAADAFTEAFDGNPDLYDGFANSSTLPTAVQPGIGDSYASVLFEGGYAESPDVVHRGTHDGYGSILIDIGHQLDW